MGSESRYEALLEVLHPAIWTVAADGCVTAVSVGAEDLSGWPAAAAWGRPWAQVAETLELTCREPFSFAAPPAEWPPIVRQECEITTSAGARRFVSLSCRVLDDGNAPTLVVMEDLTPGYRAAQSLDDSERRYGALFETLVAGVLVASEDGQVVDCNAAVCTMLGAGREEVLAHKLGDFVPREVRRQVPSLDNPDLQGEGYSFECHARRLNGESLPVEVHLRTVRFGDELLAVAHVRDVTLRHAAEAALRESKDTAWAMLNATHDYAMLLSADGTVLGANEAMARSLGVPLADLLGRNAYGCMPHNYYVYANPLDQNRFFWLPWDLNEALASRRHDGCVPNSPMLDEIVSGAASVAKEWPLIKYILGDPIYRESYRGYLRAVLDSGFAASTLTAQMQADHDLVAPYVDGSLASEQGAVKDGLFTGWYTYQTSTLAEFKTSLTRTGDGASSSDGLLVHAEKRRQAVEAALAGL